MKRFSVIILVIGMLLFGTLPVAAHANLVRSIPAAGSTLATAPAAITLEFSEDLDPGFSRVRLFDSANTPINAGPGTIDAQSPHVLRLALGKLANGTYTAIWRSRSAADGHVTEGNVPFGVGVPVSAAALIPPPGTPEPATLPPPAGSSAIRWLNLLAAVLTLGALPFALLVWRPAFRAANAEQRPDLDQRTGRALRTIIVVGGALLLLASTLFLIDQAATAAGVSLTQAAVGAPVLQLLGSRTGRLWHVRVGLTLAIMVLALRLPAPGAGAAWPWWLGIALGAALLLTFSLNGHGAAEAEGAALAVALDWLHIAATTAWIGGLLPLACVLLGARRGKNQTLPLAHLIPRFSLLAGLCVATLTLSGLYSYFVHVGSLQLLLDTTYGRALASKIGLFGLLVVLGAWNLLVLSPGLPKANTKLAHSFTRTVLVELSLGALVLLAVGAMTSVAPSKAAWSEQQRLGVVQHAAISGVDMRLQVAPAQIGDNEIAVDVRDTRPGTQDQPTKVLLRFAMLGMEMTPIQAETESADAQRYVARGSYLSMGGRWHIEAILRRAGFEDVRHTFEIDIVKSAQP